ncbi:MAG: hypothetical protein IT292_03870 [Deltaproteobacteria bacterium]|nr:hypothetical protein [Deltaproteobacteria bacterium]
MRSSIGALKTSSYDVGAEKGIEVTIPKSTWFRSTPRTVGAINVSGEVVVDLIRFHDNTDASLDFGYIVSAE